MECEYKNLTQSHLTKKQKYLTQEKNFIFFNECFKFNYL